MPSGVLVTLAAPLVHIELDVVPVISYAMAHNRIPVVQRIALRAEDYHFEGATLTVSISDAESGVSAPFETLVDLVAGQDTVLTDVKVVADPAAMLQVEEQRPARITVQVLDGDEVVGEAVEDVQLLAARQWYLAAGEGSRTRGPSTLALELLSSFVMPNDPAVTELLHEAGALLQSSTGDPSTQGYQSGPDRADEIAAALATAMQNREIRYSNPPAGWGDVGQKIRTPSEVLDGRVGTCIDTVVVLAAALEQAGLLPLLWVVDGHAFLGYWRDEDYGLSSSVEADADQLVNRIDLGHMRLVETTMLTVRDEPFSVDALHRQPYTTWLSRGTDKIVAVVDVRVARISGINPLPARRVTADGVQVVEYVPAVHSGGTATPAVTAGSPRKGKRGTSSVPARVQQWKNTLLDLSLRNRLINFTERAGMQLAVPDGRLGHVEDLISAGQSLTLLPADQLDKVHAARGVRSGPDLPAAQLADVLDRQKALYVNVLANNYLTRMRGQAYKARTLVEETGANNFYLALGSLHWNIEGKQLRSPLILIPVNLVTRARGTTYRIELDESGASTPNYCLLEKLRQVHGLDVPGLAVPEQDASGIDLEAALDAMRIAVAEAGLPYRVEHTADLAILQFAKFRLWKDLDEHWPAFLENPLVRHLVEQPHQAFDDPAEPLPDAFDLDELDASCPVPADASQLKAVAEAVHGRTFVLEGPPGTGKSQTITNMLTRAVAEGRRVLFVAEKRAALDVVRQRMDAVGMGDFSLDLHDKGSKPAVVRAQIKAALDHAVAVDEQGLSAQLEQLRTSRRGLARYAERLHEKNGAGFSYYSARTSLLALGDDDAYLPVPDSLLVDSATPALNELRTALEDLPDAADLARPSQTHPWYFCRQGLAEAELPAVRQAVEQVDVAAQLAVAPELRPLLDAARTPAELRVFSSLVRAPVALEVLDETRRQPWQQSSRRLREELSRFQQAQHPGLDVVDEAVLDLPLEEIRARAKSAEASGFFGRKKRLRAVFEELRPALRQNADVPPKQVPALLDSLVLVQTAARQVTAQAASLPGIALPDGWNALTPAAREVVDRQLTWLDWAGKAVAPHGADDPSTGFSAALRDHVTRRPQVASESVSGLTSLADAFDTLASACGADDDVWRTWSASGGLLHRWTSTRKTRNVSDSRMVGLRRWAEVVTQLEPLRKHGLQQARSWLLSGSVDAADAAIALERGLAQASVREREQATGLDSFDADAHDRTVERFTRASGQVRDQLMTAVPRQVLERRPFQAGASRGQVGALQRELAKQRRGMGVRKLLATYGDLITQIMPCVLVSPDSVARFFPVGSQVFDTVVFDEASQIRVADAIGAMGRSTSVVVVGDSKQMPPTAFGEPAGAGEDEAPNEDLLVVEDEESILSECVQAGLPQHWLSWHYRSKDESLIAFSNQHYYEGRLSSFPTPNPSGRDSGANGRGISLVRVDGAFHRSGKGKLLRTNPVEAEAVVAEIRRRFESSPESLPSIGVVTFNQQQRAYIEALLRDSGDERLIVALDDRENEGLFVKNLENVQGDERDVILFSTAFSVNERGMLPLNFGPLNRAGGQRRLNVAVTRARRQIVVFSSFDPGQLRAEETTSLGVKHLRAYLDLAASGTAALPSSGRRAPGLDRHRDEIAEALRERKLVVSTDVGLSDFKVDLTVATKKRPDHPVLAVLLDGPGWAKRRTVGDRDGLPPQVLSGLMEWPAVERVWLPAWLQDDEAVLDRLEQSCKEGSEAVKSKGRPSKAKAQEPSAAARQPRAAAPAPTMAPSARSAEAGLQLKTMPAAPQASSELADESLFVAWTPPRTGSRQVLDDLPSHYAAHEVRQALTAAVAAEGPVHTDRLAKLVAGAFGLTRVSASRTRDILAQLPRDLVPDRKEPFAWPTDKRPDTWTGFRRATADEPRPIDEISLRELSNAMVALCIAAAGMTEEELLRETVAVFGGRRLTTGISTRVAEALDVAVSVGRLRQAGSGVYSAT
jgi:hypothetical protein